MDYSHRDLPSATSKDEAAVFTVIELNDRGKADGYAYCLGRGPGLKNFTPRTNHGLSRSLRGLPSLITIGAISQRSGGCDGYFFLVSDSSLALFSAAEREGRGGVTEDITGLLLQWRAGDESALDQLMPLVYDELHRLARQCMRRERSQHTLQTTALVNEAYLRMVKSSQVNWHDRAHFFAVAAQLMRRVLVDEARKRNFQKRGGELTRIELDEALMPAHQREFDLVALDQALDRLAQFAPRKSRVVELRFFGGLSLDETGAVLGVSTDIVKREWRTAKLWLLNELSWSGKQPAVTT